MEGATSEGVWLPYLRGFHVKVDSKLEEVCREDYFSDPGWAGCL